MIKRNKNSMKISGGFKESGIVVGNAFDKYNSKNPVVRLLMHSFDKALSDFVKKASPKSIHEIGCGEGYWVLGWNQKGIRARGSDFSSKVIGIANQNAKQHEVSESLFTTQSIYEVSSPDDVADLIVCCEVLEHLDNPEGALKALQGVVSNYIILSVPREPIWRGLNLVRGKYISSLGNTPGHIQHWSCRDFINLVSKYFDIIEVRTPFPWTMVLCKTCK